MPGLKSPSTEPDSIFGGAFGGGAALFDSGTRCRAYASGDFDTAEHDIDDPPPPFKEFESPINVQGECLGGRQEGAAEEDGQDVVTVENTGEVGDAGVQETGGGAQGGDETSQDAGEYTRRPGENTAEMEEDAGHNLGGVQEQEESKEEETKLVKAQVMVIKEQRMITKTQARLPKPQARMPRLQAVIPKS